MGMVGCCVFSQVTLRQGKTCNPLYSPLNMTGYIELKIRKNILRQDIIYILRQRYKNIIRQILFRNQFNSTQAILSLNGFHSQAR